MRATLFVSLLALAAAAPAAYADDVITLGSAISITGKYSQEGKNARDGYDFAEIAVRVHVAAAAHVEQKALKRQWDSAEATPLFELADRLPEGPLRAALARWSRRARGR